jgi:sec-independent protein translocase protein TatC
VPSDDANQDNRAPSAPAGGNNQPGQAQPEPSNTHIEPSYAPDGGDYAGYDDPYTYDPHESSSSGSSSSTTPVIEPAENAVARTSDAPPPPPVVPSSSKGSDDEDDGDSDDEGMLRMSFLEHLEELRRRLIFAVGGLGAAFVVCLSFTERLWLIVQEPAAAALSNLGYTETSLVQTSPMEAFSIIWVKLPLLCALFVASPWLLYQVWAFVAPGLYQKERRFAVPFILSAATLFIAGGLFAYYVAFRFGLTFLLGIGQNVNVKPLINITEYFDIFVNVILGVAVVFELPILIFFLTLLRIASPRFLLANSRYAVLAIVVLAAVITPTPDIVNLMLFSVPMVILYFVGIFASYLLVLSRDNQRFPWRTFLIAVLIPVILIGAGVYLAVTKYGYKLVLYWPFLTR